MKYATIQKHKINLISFEAALDFALSSIENGENCHIVTVNPEMIEIAAKNKRFANILDNCTLSLADGVGIKCALKLKSVDVQNIRGVEFSKKLLSLCAQRNYKVALLGANQNVIELTVANLKKEFPTLNIVYYNNGYFENETQVKKDIISTSPQLLLVALGAPKQEFFIQDILNSLSGCCAIGVGGSFDVYSGLTQESPEVFRKLGLEWFYRTISDPKRIKRIFPTLPIFLFKSIIESIREKFFIYGND